MTPITPSIARTIVAYVAEGQSFARAAGLIRAQLTAIRPYTDARLVRCLAACDRAAGWSDEKQARTLATLQAHADSMGRIVETFAT